MNDMGTAALAERVLTEAEAEALLRNRGIPAALYQRRRPGRKGPPYRMTDDGPLYRITDIDAWAAGYRGRCRLDMMATALGRWLHERRMSPPEFARSVPCGAHTIYKLVGHKSARTLSRPSSAINSDTLETISIITDIGVGTLVEDMIDANR